MRLYLGSWETLALGYSLGLGVGFVCAWLSIREHLR